jgi:hypothetical protein
MEILLIVLTVGLPLLKFVLFPARTMGRGGNWTIVGAVMIVGLMMALWFGLKSFTDVTGDPQAASATAAAAGTGVPDLSALAKLF